MSFVAASDNPDFVPVRLNGSNSLGGELAADLIFSLISGEADSTVLVPRRLSNSL